MEILEVIRNKEQMKKTKHISCSTFDQLSGTLLLATSEVFRYQLQTRPEHKVQVDQQMTVAANYLQQMNAANDRKGTFAIESEA